MTNKVRYQSMFVRFLGSLKISVFKISLVQNCIDFDKDSKVKGDSVLYIHKYILGYLKRN